MKRKNWKQIMAAVMAATMIVTSPGYAGGMTQVKAESTNLFTDGDLGDDDTDDIWSGTWTFGEDAWGVVDASIACLLKSTYNISGFHWFLQLNSFDEYSIP